MVWNPQPDRSPARVLQPFGDLASGRQNECVWSRCHRFDQSIGPVVDPGIQADLGKVPAYQCEVVLLVRTSNSVYPVDRLRVANVATKRIARIGGIRDEPAFTDNLNHFRHAARLRVRWVHFNDFRHARIVGQLRSQIAEN